MINELLRFKKSIESWGFEIQRSYHPKINGNAKGVGIIVRFSETGFTVAEFPEYAQSYHFRQNNSKKFPTFKYSDDLKDLSNSCVSNMSLGNDLVKELEQEGGPNYELFKTLVERVNRTEVGKLITTIDAFLTEKSIPRRVYVSLDLDGDETINNKDFTDWLSEALYNIDKKNASGKDFFGNSLDGFDEVFPTIGIGPPIGAVPLYCRNKDNQCYQRFGLNSVYAACVGSQSRAELSDLLKLVLTKSKQATLENKGIWYQISVGDSRKYLVLTSLSANDQTFERGNSDVEPDEWEGAMRLFVSTMLKPNKLTNQLSGHIIVIRQLKGAWKVVLEEQKSVEQMAHYIDRWVDGTYNGSLQRKVIPASIVGFLNQINTIWRTTGKDSGSRFDIQDVYQFLFDHKPTITKIAQTFSENIVPMLLKNTGVDFSEKGQSNTKSKKKNGNSKEPSNGSPFEVCILGPMQNLILHKLGHIYNQEECAMEHWAFYLGRLFQEANSLYYKFFRDRGMNPPAERIGQRFVGMAYVNPRIAYHNFIAAFVPTHNWAEKVVNGRSNAYTLAYRELVCKMTELAEKQLPNATLPVVPSALDRMMLCAGYMHFQKREKVEEPQPTESVAVV